MFPQHLNVAFICTHVAICIVLTDMCANLTVVLIQLALNYQLSFNLNHLLNKKLNCLLITLPLITFC